MSLNAIGDNRFLSICAHSAVKKSWNELVEIGQTAINKLGHDARYVHLNYRGRFQKNWTIKTALNRDVDLEDPEVDFHFFNVFSTFPENPKIKNVTHCSFCISCSEDAGYCYYEIMITADLSVLAGRVSDYVLLLFELLANEFPDVCGYAILFKTEGAIHTYASTIQGNNVPPNNHPLLEEFEWYYRLREPIRLSLEHGRFRSVYRWNLLNEKQHNWMSRSFYSQENKIGKLDELSNKHYAWLVPENKRKAAFEILKKTNATHYRFFHSSEGIM